LNYKDLLTKNELGDNELKSVMDLYNNLIRNAKTKENKIKQQFDKLDNELDKSLIHLSDNCDITEQ
jgi:septation ring formation regulator EzrA